MASAPPTPLTVSADEVISRGNVALAGQLCAKERRTIIGLARLAPLGFVIEEQRNKVQEIAWAFHDRLRVRISIAPPDHDAGDASYNGNFIKIGATIYHESTDGSDQWTTRGFTFPYFEPPAGEQGGIFHQLFFGNTIFTGTNRCNLLRLSAVPCAEGTCFMLERDVRTRYPDGKTTDVHEAYSGWGVLNIIEAPASVR